MWNSCLTNAAIELHYCMLEIPTWVPCLRSHTYGVYLTSKFWYTFLNGLMPVDWGFYSNWEEILRKWIESFGKKALVSDRKFNFFNILYLIWNVQLGCFDKNLTLGLLANFFIRIFISCWIIENNTQASFIKLIKEKTLNLNVW